MIKNILNIVGWLGTALVVAAVAVRFLRPEWDQYAVYAAWAGLACVVLYTLGQWREILDYFQQRNARYGAIAGLSVLIFIGVLVKALNPNKKKVYFLQGHGERDIDSMDRDGYSEVKAALGRDNYDVAKVVLAQEKDVPADASVVVIAGPKTDLFQPEADMLQRFLRKGGHVFVMVDPPDEKAAATPVLDAFLKDWDFQAGKDVVVDASGMGQLIGTDASVPVVATYPQHPITERFNVITAFPLARSITPILPASNGRAAVPIIQTSARSWAETDMAQLRSGRVELNADKGDKQGPVTIGAVTATTATDAQKTEGATADQHPPESRFVTIGDSDFAANYAIRIQGNQDLFLNTTNWLAQQENLISIRPKPPSDSRLTITARQANAVAIMSLLVIPALVFGTGVYAWWRKR